MLCRMLLLSSCAPYYNAGMRIAFRIGRIQTVAMMCSYACAAMHTYRFARPRTPGGSIFSAQLFDVVVGWSVVRARRKRKKKSSHRSELTFIPPTFSSLLSMFPNEIDGLFSMLPTSTSTSTVTVASRLCAAALVHAVRLTRRFFASSSERAASSSAIRSLLRRLSSSTFAV